MQFLMLIRMPELLFRLGPVKLGEALRGRSLGSVQRRDACEHRIDRDEIGKTTGLELWRATADEDVHYCFAVAL
jgi:hypothetical protein